MTRLLFAVSLVAACALVSGCTLEPVADDQDNVVGDNPYRDGFAHITATPFESDITPDALIDVWVSEDAADEYSQVLLDGAGSGVSLAEGTVIVREVLDQEGTIQTLTLMIKGAPGYYPEGGDWWYGVAEPDGSIRTGDDGTPLMGRLDDCGSCHASRPDDDFLFGVPSGYHATR